MSHIFSIYKYGNLIDFVYMILYLQIDFSDHFIALIFTFFGSFIVFYYGFPFTLFLCF